MSEQQNARVNEFDQKTEYMVFHNIEKHIRHRKALARWPLHVTIVPPFRITESNEDKLSNLVREIASDFTPIHLRPGEQVMFGPSNDRPASRVVDSSGELRTLHERFMWDLGSVGCHEVDATYAYDDYNPHYTWIRGVFPPVDGFSLDTLSIAKKVNGVKLMLETIRIEY